MKKIFCILCHKVTNPLIFTITYLSSFAENIILIHVDAKSSLDDFQSLAASNVHFVQNRVCVTWGSYSQVASTLNTFSEALQWNFDYLFLLSGDDIPNKSNETMNNFLHSINKKNLIHFQDSRNNYVDPEKRVKYRYPDVFYSRRKSIPEKIKILAFKSLRNFFITDVFKKHANKKIQFYKGTNWFSLNHPTVNSVMMFVSLNKWYCDLFQYSFCSDEVFFHTIIKLLGRTDLYHDELKLNDALRYIDWKTGPDYPRVLDESDFANIKNSGCFFSRKHPADLSFDVFDKLLSE